MEHIILSSIAIQPFPDPGSRGLCFGWPTLIFQTFRKPGEDAVTWGGWQPLRTRTSTSEAPMTNEGCCSQPHFMESIISLCPATDNNLSDNPGVCLSAIWVCSLVKVFPWPKCREGCYSAQVYLNPLSLQAPLPPASQVLHLAWFSTVLTRSWHFRTDYTSQDQPNYLQA